LEASEFATRSVWIPTWSKNIAMVRWRWALLLEVKVEHMIRVALQSFNVLIDMDAWEQARITNRGSVHQD
jgi:hypothetical protein